MFLRLLNVIVFFGCDRVCWMCMYLDVWNVIVFVVCDCVCWIWSIYGSWILRHFACHTGRLEYIGVHCSIFLYIYDWLCSLFHSSFEYTLRSTWRLNAQYNLAWVYLNRRMRWHICWPKWFIANVKNYHIFNIGRKTHLLAFSAFSRLPSARFSYIEAFMHVGHWAGL